MKALLTVADVSRLMQVNHETARKYMHQMEFIKQPFRVTEEAFQRWLDDRTVRAVSKVEKRPITKIPYRRAEG